SLLLVAGTSQAAENAQVGAPREGGAAAGAPAQGGGQVGAQSESQLYKAPGAASPTSKEQVTIYRTEDGPITGRISIPDPKLAVLVQPAGRDWREFRVLILRIVGGVFILGMILALAAFLLFKGRVRVRAGLSGRTVPRFNALERGNHWLTAVSFIVLAISGLVVTFGRPLLLPLIGHEALTTLSQAAKYGHNFFSVPFVIGIAVMFLLWAWGNLPERSDWAWIKTAGGLLGGDEAHHPEVGRFNAGQKMLFWFIIFGGAALAVSGYLLMAPFAVTGIGGMQIFHIAHALIGAVLITGIIAHIYIGSVGMEGAFDAMGKGRVDENWAYEHHGRWLAELRDRGVVPTEEGRRTAGQLPAE
ncbi:MAG TPA: formate dehydrogenase subunit gamma, partial [Geminicoccaceae bacterium]